MNRATLSLWALLCGVAFIASVIGWNASDLWASTDERDCVGELPLLQQRPQEPEGEWRLPLSADRLDIVTEARLTAHLANSSSRSRFIFSFPDPKPFGIPFTFRKFEIRWIDHEGEHVESLDWSEDCSSPGRSLFPGQSWGFEVETHANPRAVEILLWGSRN